MKVSEPPYTERYVRWCERTGASRPLLLDSSVVPDGQVRYFLTLLSAFSHAEGLCAPGFSSLPVGGVKHFHKTAPAPGTSHCCRFFFKLEFAFARQASEFSHRKSPPLFLLSFVTCRSRGNLITVYYTRLPCNGKGIPSFLLYAKRYNGASSISKGGQQCAFQL